MLDLLRRLAESKTGFEKTLLSRQIEATDKQIDRLVRELYGLTAEEIAIVEDADRRARPAGRYPPPRVYFQCYFKCSI